MYAIVNGPPSHSTCSNLNRVNIVNSRRSYLIIEMHILYLYQGNYFKMIGFLPVHLWHGSAATPVVCWNCACGVVGDEHGVSVPEDAVNNPTMTNWPCPEEVADTHLLFGLIHSCVCVVGSVAELSFLSLSLSLARPPRRDGNAPVATSTGEGAIVGSARIRSSGSSCLGEVEPFRRSPITSQHWKLDFCRLIIFSWLISLT